MSEQLRKINDMIIGAAGMDWYKSSGEFYEWKFVSDGYLVDKSDDGTQYKKYKS